MNGLNLSAARNVARKDIKILLKERGTLFYLFVVPIVFILAFSLSAGVKISPKEKAIILTVVNLKNLSANSRFQRIL